MCESNICTSRSERTEVESPGLFMGSTDASSPTYTQRDLCASHLDLCILFNFMLFDSVNMQIVFFL